MNATTKVDVEATMHLLLCLWLFMRFPGVPSVLVFMNEMLEGLFKWRHLQPIGGLQSVGVTFRDPLGSLGTPSR